MDDEESPIDGRKNVKTSIADRIQLWFALLVLCPILYGLVVYSLFTFVWSATICPLRISQLLFPKLVTSSYTRGTPRITFVCYLPRRPCISFACGFQILLFARWKGETRVLAHNRCCITCVVCPLPHRNGHQGLQATITPTTYGTFY